MIENINGSTLTLVIGTNKQKQWSVILNFNFGSGNQSPKAMIESNGGFVLTLVIVTNKQKQYNIVFNFNFGFRNQ